MENKTLQELESRLKKLKPVYKNGACGWTAFFISQYLEENGIPHKIIMFQWGKYKNIHVMVKLDDGRFIDSTGLNFGLWYKLTCMKQNMLTREQLRTYLGIRSMWNYKFDFDKVSDLREIVLNQSKLTR